MTSPDSVVEPDLITVVVLSYRRPRLLERCLTSARALRPPPGRRVEILVVDDSPDEEGGPVVARCGEGPGNSLRYLAQAGGNISEARNRGLAEARGEYVAFLDDDEWAPVSWLEAMTAALESQDADAVFGPSYAEFAGDSLPAFVTDSSFYDRDPVLPTGTVCEVGSTANVLLRRSLIPGGVDRFDPDFGRTGGEDFEFFLRRRQAGAIYVWCQEGAVHNYVPLPRKTRRYMSHRSFREGQTTTLVRTQLSSTPLREAAWWMTKGAVEAGVFGPLAFVALVGAPLHGSYHLRRFSAGLGKLLWFPWFRIEPYTWPAFGADQSLDEA